MTKANSRLSGLLRGNSTQTANSLLATVLDGDVTGYFENGNKKAIAIVATNEIYTEKNGEKVKQTVWHKVIAWGKKADELALSFKKGTKVAIHGKLANKTYTDSKGTTRCVTEIVATEFYKIEKATKHTAEAVPF